MDPGMPTFFSINGGKERRRKKRVMCVVDILGSMVNPF